MFVGNRTCLKTSQEQRCTLGVILPAVVLLGPAGASSTVFRRPGTAVLSSAVGASCPLGPPAPQRAATVKGCTLLSGLFLAKLLQVILP